MLAVLLAAAVVLTGCRHNGSSSTPPSQSYAPPSTSSAPKPAGAAFSHGDIVKAVAAGAKAGITKLGTYSYQHFDDDVKAVEADLTPSYASRYAAKTKGLKATVVRLKNTSAASNVVIGISDIDVGLESATVIAGFTQTLTGVTVPHRTVTKVVAVVGMVELNRKWLINSLAIPPAGPPTAATPTVGSQPLLDAVTAAVSEVTTLGTLSKAHFDSDYKKWLSVSTGSLKSKLAKAESSTKTSYEHTDAHLTSVCKAVGVVTASNTKVELLIYVTASGKRTTNTLSRMTLENVKGHWLTESLTAV